MVALAMDKKNLKCITACEWAREHCHGHEFKMQVYCEIYIYLTIICMKSTDKGSEDMDAFEEYFFKTS